MDVPFLWLLLVLEFEVTAPTIPHILGLLPTLLSTNQLSCGRFSPKQGEYFTGDVARVRLGSQEDKSWGNLFRLGWSFHRCLLAEVSNLFCRLIGGIERRPHRTWYHTVNANTFLHEVLRERLGKRVNRPFCR